MRFRHSINLPSAAAQVPVLGGRKSNLGCYLKCCANVPCCGLSLSVVLKTEFSKYCTTLHATPVALFLPLDIGICHWLSFSHD